MNPDSEHLSAPEAAERLGVKRATLYAYASRGLIRSFPGGRGPARLYLRADVERLRARGANRRGAGEPQPLLDSSITWLAPEGPFYRGHSSVSLAARGVSFERVAELLFGGELPPEEPAWPTVEPAVPLAELLALARQGVHVLELLALLVAAEGARDPDRHDILPEAVLPRARRLIRLCAAATAGVTDPARREHALAASGIAESLACALGARRGPRAARALNAMLVLMADHELNASTFAARVAASAGADLYACLLAGLATLSGPRHGAASERVAALVREMGTPERAEAVLRERLRRGELIPGFGHAVYSERDPRCAPLLEAARDLAPRSRTVRVVDAAIAAMRRARRPPPNVDVALTALAAALGIAPQHAPALFAVARMAGWTAHSLEQYGTGVLLRPRARYLASN